MWKHYFKIYEDNNNNLKYKSSSILTVLYIHIISFLFIFTGIFIINIIRLKSYEYRKKYFFKIKIFKKKINYYSVVDIYLLLVLIIELIVWNYKPDSIFFSSCFLFIIYSITIIKLNEIITLEKDKPALGYKIYSLNRTFILSIINFFELFLSFSYIYKNINIINQLDIDSIFITFNTFLSGGVFQNKNIVICQNQKNYIALQLFSFFIFIFIFITNISNLSYKNKQANTKKKPNVI